MPAIATISVCCCVVLASPVAEFSTENGDTQLKTNIAVLDSSASLRDFVGGSNKQQGALTVVDPTQLLENAPNAPKLDDIEEDPKDPFITTRSGKRRPMLVDSEPDWADEAPMARIPRIVAGLSRVKRCGGGGGGGGGDYDDDDVNRARRTRRARRARRARRNRAKRARKAARKAERKAAKAAASKTTTTTVTRKVIKNGQVVSETTEAGGEPMVSSCAQEAQPVVAAAPVVVQQPVATATVPSISVQGSINVN